jgi:hypothetical protein
MKKTLARYARKILYPRFDSYLSGDFAKMSARRYVFLVRLVDMTAR